MVTVVLLSLWFDGRKGRGEGDEVNIGRGRERERERMLGRRHRPRAPGREIPPPRLRGIIFGDNGWKTWLRTTRAHSPFSGSSLLPGIMSLYPFTGPRTRFAIVSGHFAGEASRQHPSNLSSFSHFPLSSSTKHRGTCIEREDNFWLLSLSLPFSPLVDKPFWSGNDRTLGNSIDPLWTDV